MRYALTILFVLGAVALVFPCCSGTGEPQAATGASSGGGADADAGDAGCATCAEYVGALLVGSAADLCLADRDPFAAVQACACGAPGACTSACVSTFCDAIAASPGCKACIEDGGCAAEFAACE